MHNKITKDLLSWDFLSIFFLFCFYLCAYAVLLFSECSVSLSSWRIFIFTAGHPDLIYSSLVDTQLGCSSLFLSSLWISIQRLYLRFSNLFQFICFAIWSLWFRCCRHHLRVFLIILMRFYALELVRWSLYKDHNTTIENPVTMDMDLAGSFSVFQIRTHKYMHALHIFTFKSVST